MTFDQRSQKIDGLCIAKQAPRQLKWSTDRPPNKRVPPTNQHQQQKHFDAKLRN